MRIRIIFKVLNKGAVLPFHHQSPLHDLLQGHAEKHGRSFDQITFSGLKGQTKICKEGLKYISKNVTLVLSSTDRSLLETITFSLFQSERVQLGQLELFPEWVEAEASPKFSKQMQYLCISPLIPYPKAMLQGEGHQLKIPFDIAFEELLKQSLQERMYVEGNFDSKDLEDVHHIRFLPDTTYLDRLTQRDKKYARDYALQTEEGPARVKGYTFPFTLNATPRIQQFVFQTGLGSCPDLGFGMLDIAKNQLKRQQLFHRRDIENGKIINPLTRKVSEKSLAQTADR